jgi:hypothetical protein
LLKIILLKYLGMKVQLNGKVISVTAKTGSCMCPKSKNKSLFVLGALSENENIHIQLPDGTLSKVSKLDPLTFAKNNSIKIGKNFKE